MNKMTGEEFLQSKDIWNHPNLTDRNNKESYDIAELLEEYAELKPTKRRPLADGTLPLTDEELREFDKQYNVKRGWESIGVYLRKTSYGAHYLTRKYYDPNSFEGKRIEEVTFDYLEAILWLAERFNLTEVSDEENGRLESWMIPEIMYGVRT